MTTYTKLTQDEKDSIIEGTVRNLEYQMYGLEIEIVAENAKSNPNAERIQILNAGIAEKKAQIAAVEG